jgi:hypothetical protein
LPIFFNNTQQDVSRKNFSIICFLDIYQTKKLCFTLFGLYLSTCKHMIRNIKVIFALLFFLAGFNLSYGQTTDSQDSTNQNSNAPELNQQQNAGENSTTVDTTIHTPQLNGVNEGNSTIDRSGNIIPNNNTEPTERVKGTRAPNEYPSGRSGGQYSAPKPKVTK